MSSDASGFQLTGTAPEAYERYMVPIHCMDHERKCFARLVIGRRTAGEKISGISGNAIDLFLLQ